MPPYGPQCAGIISCRRNRGNRCFFRGRILHTNGEYYCLKHLNAFFRPRVATPSTTSTGPLALMRCSGITKRGTVCKKHGSRIHNGSSYCNVHIPVDFVDLTAEPQRPIVQYGDISVDVEEDCPICFKKLKFETIVKTNCGHAFHKSCIDRWLQSVPQCPMCRTTTHIKRGNTHRIEVVEYE